jgi:hypothetical protein
MDGAGCPIISKDSAIRRPGASASSNALGGAGAVDRVLRDPVDDPRRVIATMSYLVGTMPSQWVKEYDRCAHTGVLERGRSPASGHVGIP